MAQVEGKVTEICEHLLCFKIEKTTIHLLLYFIQNCSIKLPEIGSSVKITSSCFHSKGDKVSSVVLIPNESVYEGENLWLVHVENSFLNVIKEVSPSAEDVYQFARNYDDFSKFFKSGSEGADVFQSLIYKLKGNLNFTLNFPQQLKFVDNHRDSYENFTFYTFGVNRSYVNKVNNYLFGFLYMSKENGTAYLSDFKSCILCIIMKEWNNYECCVCIRRYIVINEVYNGTNFFSTQYLLIDSSDVIIIDQKRNENLPNLDFLIANQYNKKTCKILKKSLFMATAANTSQFFLQVCESNLNKYFLLLDSSYCTIYSSLKFEKYYYLYCKSAPKGTINREITVFDPSSPLYKLPPQSFFIPTDFPQEPTKILTAAEAHLALNSSEVISFEATISLKKFVPANSSRTQNLSQSSNFGTPSLKTHLLEFANKLKPLTLYLNNWEYMSVPYGLIPNMRVIVCNVKPQNGRYFKSTPFTSFQVVRYEPQVPFESANLYHRDWGSPYYLGAGKNIPRDTILWTKVLSFFILGLKIFLTDKGALSPTITLICLDLMGESKVIAKNQDALPLLKLLLGMRQESVFEKWCQSFVSGVRSYQYFKGIDLMRMPSTGNMGMITRSLTRYFEGVGNQIQNLELMCRKLDTEPNGKPVYYFIQGRTN